MTRANRPARMVPGVDFEPNEKLLPSSAPMKPLELSIKTVEEAEADLAAHERRFPGDYWTCYKAGTLDSRRAWLVERDRLLCALDLAKSFRETPPSPKAAVIVKRPRKAPAPVQAPRPRKSLEDLVARFEDRLQRLGMLPGGSKEWHQTRALVCSARSEVFRRAKEEGVQAPELKPIPVFIATVGVIIPEIPKDRPLTPQEAGRLGGQARQENVSKSALWKRKDRERKRSQGEE